MVKLETKAPGYLDTLLLYFEEEIMGEAYFLGLTDHFDDPGQRDKLTLLAQVERHAAEAVRPLLHKYDLSPRPDKELKPLGEAWMERHTSWDWGELVKDMSVRYQGYVDDFERLENMAPSEDLPALKILTDHEVVAIEFANREIAGDPMSSEPLRRYLASPVTCT
ncbi:MAG: hypothetical protein OER56_16950 [Hyphomicrobiales bacterium]|nr:hypothetical protein [Hyphomicrobiales bacterium]